MLDIDTYCGFVTVACYVGPLEHLPSIVVCCLSECIMQGRSPDVDCAISTSRDYTLKFRAEVWSCAPASRPHYFSLSGMLLLDKHFFESYYTEQTWLHLAIETLLSMKLWQQWVRG